MVSGEQVDLIPRGFEVLGGAVCGYTDISLADPYYLSVQRSQPTPQANLDGYPIIDDICFVFESEGEEPPASDYIMLDRCLIKKGNIKIYLAYHVRKPQGLCNVKYEAHTIDRYPQDNYRDMELPVLELPVFVFPHGLQLIESKRGEYPLPVFFTFVFTDAKGEHYYAACLQFYELVNECTLIRTCEGLYKSQPSTMGENDEDDGDDCGDTNINTSTSTNSVQDPQPQSQSTLKEYCCLPSHKSVYAPKVICVLTKKPFYRAMRRYLRQLYSLSLSVTSCPIEYFISSVVGQVCAYGIVCV